MSDFIVAGPILRRVTPDIVCVWLLTNRKETLKLSVFQENKLLATSNIEEIGQQRFALGDKLFVYLLQAKSLPLAKGNPASDRPIKAFPYDQLLTYQISLISGQNQETVIDLKRLGLTYGNSVRPSFFIGKNLKNILHGSCRKPHGNAKPVPKIPGLLQKILKPIKELFEKTIFDENVVATATSDFNYDALSLADNLINENLINLNNRPELLILTGDQIYADDVADSLGDLVKIQGGQLLGFQEWLPNHSNDKAGRTLADSIITMFKGIVDFFKLKKDTFNYDIDVFDPSTIPVHSRQTWADKYAGFSSDAADNHLFTFGEFAAMYVYVFGNALGWKPDFRGENDNLKPALESFHKSLPSVRRLLANIPTYMIFDDHDVTDDWNITGGWYDKVRNSPLGQRVISNALAAYWVFQGWGNQPENFDSNFITAVTDFFCNSTHTDPKHNPDFKIYGDRFDLITWKHRGWSYSIPSNPPVLVLDSRTQRQPDKAFYPPQLLDRYALDWLRVEWSDLKVKKSAELNKGIIAKLPEWPLFVATTPVMGVSIVEGLQQLVLWFITWFEDLLIIRFIEKIFRLGGAGTYYLGNHLDVESWMANRDGFGAFLNCLLSKIGIGKCVFLSGDVHYSFSALSFFFDNEKKQLQCWQLTSSSLSNVPQKKQIDLINKIAKAEGKVEHNNTWAFTPSQRWRTIIQYLATQDSENSENKEFVAWKANVGLVEFDDGIPISHTLINKNSRDVFQLNKNAE